MRLVIVDNPNVVFDEDGNATFTPPADFFGVISIAYSVEDAVGNITSAQWTITVIEVKQSEAITQGGGGSTGPLLILIMGIITLVRRTGRGE